MKLTHDELVAWAESMAGQWIAMDHDGFSGRLRAPAEVVDYKLDTVGLGAFFVIDRGADWVGDNRWSEVYRLPPQVARSQAGRRAGYTRRQRQSAPDGS